MKTRTPSVLLSAATLMALTGCYDAVGEIAVDSDTETATGGIDTMPDSGDTGEEGSSSDSEEPPELDGPGSCVETKTFFREQVWAPFMSQQCFACHNPGGQAKNTDLVLQANDVPGHADANLAAIRGVARLQLDGESLILVKARGEDDHGGGPQLLATDADYEALADLVAQLEEGPTVCSDDADVDAFFTGVEMMGETETLRRATFALAARRPTPEEIDAVKSGGEAAIDEVIRTIVAEDPTFSARVVEMFNQTLLTDGFIGGTKALDLLAAGDYPGKNWFDEIADTTASNQARSRSNTALAREPLELIRYIVENGRPMTDIVNATYTVANPDLARVYGLDTSVFADMTDTGEWHPFTIEEFPHAGVLTTPAYLGRYPTTTTNRNRQRAQKTLAFFLATDVMSLGSRPIGTDSVAEHNPTMDNPQCTNCHEIMDPVAGAFMNWDDIGHHRPLEGWHQDMVAPGFGEEIMPTAEYPYGLQWLGQRLADDVRFSRAMVDMVFQGLAGQKVLAEPTDPGAPNYAAEITAFHVQDKVFSEIAADFAASGYDYATLVGLLVRSGYYRAKNFDGDLSAQRQLELADLGSLRLSSPEQFHRKIAAVTGYTWLDDENKTLLTRGRPLHLMFGGIDSESVTEPFEEVNGVMANITSRMANEMACRATSKDFALPASERVLFPFVEADMLPGFDDDDIEANILYLHEQILGEELASGDPRIAETRFLFENVRADGVSGIDVGDYPATLIGPCRQTTHPETGDPLDVPIVDDPDYTIRAWMAVVSAMLGDFQFMYE